MGAPDTSVRQCSLAMNKWEKLHVAPIQTMLGLVIDTNRMTIGVPDNYIQSVCLLINSTWHTHRQQFMVNEAQELTGKLGHLAKGANWVFHLLTHLYASIAYALSENKRFLVDSSPEFQTLIKSLRSGYFFCNVKDQIRHILFAIKRSAKLVHQSRCKYNITKSMRQEIEFFCKKLLPKSGIRWESPIAHISQECRHSLPSVTVASKGPEDTHFPLAFGGTCHFLKRSSYVRSYTKEIMQTVYSFQ